MQCELWVILSFLGISQWQREKNKFGEGQVRNDDVMVLAVPAGLDRETERRMKSLWEAAVEKRQTGLPSLITAAGPQLADSDLKVWWSREWNTDSTPCVESDKGFIPILTFCQVITKYQHLRWFLEQKYKKNNILPS